MGFVHRIVLLVGFFLLGHAAYSAGQYRSFIRLAEEEYTGLPSDIFLECVVASCVCMLGVILMVSNFKDIKKTTELNAQLYSSISNRTNFMTFNHRGKLICGGGM